jgi:undecaprenyl-diphosphatase
MWIGDRRRNLIKGLDSMTWTDTFLVGCAQALAIVPGVSRSGSTITAGLFRGVRRDAAARFSFLLSTPALLGAAVKALLDIHEAGGIPAGMVDEFAVGMVVSGITGWIVIAWLMRFLRTRTLRFFVYYRVVFGIILIALALFVRREG